MDVFKERDLAWTRGVISVRASLQARLEGRNEGGDTEVMRLVDEIVKKEAVLHMPGIF